jgi:septum site-determining protein MinD
VARIVSVHSFRGGTGKSNTTANVAALLAGRGLSVGVIDTDIQSPGIHVILGLAADAVTSSLNDYLFGRCAIAECAHDVTAAVDPTLSGHLHLIPASTRPGEISRILKEGYSTTRLAEGLRGVVDALGLDVLLIDTHPGLGEETLLSLVLSHAVVIVLRPDQQDYQGTAITVAVARQLAVPRMMLVVNKVPAGLEEAVSARVAAAYDCPVAAVLPHDDAYMRLASEAPYVVRHRDSELTRRFAALADELLS